MFFEGSFVRLELPNIPGGGPPLIGEVQETLKLFPLSSESCCSNFIPVDFNTSTPREAALHSGWAFFHAWLSTASLLDEGVSG